MLKSLVVFAAVSFVGCRTLDSNSDVAQNQRGNQPQPVLPTAAVTLNAQESEAAHQILTRARIPNSANGLGAVVFFLQTVKCDRIVVPGFPTSCQLLDSHASYSLNGVDAKSLYDILDRNGGNTTPPMIVGGSTTEAAAFKCSKVVAPGTMASCTFSKIRRP